MRTYSLCILLGLALSACHNGNFSLRATWQGDELVADRWCYMFASYGNQLALLDSCRIVDNTIRLSGNLPQREALVEVVIPQVGSYFLLGAKNERVALNINDTTRSFFPSCEGSYATKCMAKIARRYREIGYGKLDSLKRSYDTLPVSHPGRETLARTIREHEQELSDLVRGALSDERSLLFAATVKMWFCDSNPAISDDSLKRIVNILRRRFPDDPNLVSIDPERRASPPTTESMKAFNLKAQLTGRPLPYPKLHESGCKEASRDTYSSYKPGDVVRPFSLVGMMGKDQNIGDYATEYLLVDFWASWCTPCRKEIPHLLAVGRRFGEVLTIYAVSLDDDAVAWKDAVEKYGMHSFVNVRLSKDMPSFGELTARFGVCTIPHNFLLNSERQVIAIDLRGDALEKKLEELTGSSRPAKLE